MLGWEVWKQGGQLGVALVSLSILFPCSAWAQHPHITRLCLGCERAGC